MERADILLAVQERLIADFARAAAKAGKERGAQLRNAWILTRLETLIATMKPLRQSGAPAGREDFERRLAAGLEGGLRTLAEHLPELSPGEALRFIAAAGRIYAALQARAERELDRLQERAAGYPDPARLVEAEFERCRAFPSKAEHEAWTKSVSQELGALLDIIAVLGNLLRAKSGLAWMIKLAAAKRHLGLELELDGLDSDLALVKKSLLGAFEDYEKRLMRKRYS